MKMAPETSGPVTISHIDIANHDLLQREGFASCYSSSNSVTDEAVIYVFGGLKKKGAENPEEFTESNELILIKTASKEAKILENGEVSPCARAGASLAMAGDRLFLFGGFSHASAWLDDFWTYQLPNGPWKKEEFIATPNSPNESGEPVGTPIPTCRDKATLTAITTASGTFLWLFGGFGPDPTNSQAEGEEEEEKTVSDGYLPGDTAIEKQIPLRMRWFDDLYCINCTPNVDGRFEIKKPMQLNLDSPTARAAHAATGYIAKNGNNMVAIFGGRDPDSRTNDLSIFDTVSRKWVAYDVDDVDVGEEEDDDDVAGDEDLEDESGVESGAAQEVGDLDEEDKAADEDIAEQVKRNLEAIRRKTSSMEADVKEGSSSTSGAEAQPWPECRSYASMSVCSGRWLFIYGGRNDADRDLDDFWLFDLGTFFWQSQCKIIFVIYFH